MSKWLLGTIRTTGQTCPESRVWKALPNPSTTIPLSTDETFPPYNNQKVTWELMRYA